MFRLAVCEDDKALREQLCSLCREILSGFLTDFEVMAFSTAGELEKEMAEGTQFQLLCLDIILPGKSGMELALEVRERDEKIEILFITVSTEYLLEGYGARPIQYLIKPVDRKQLEKALATALRLSDRSTEITFSLGGKTYVLPLDGIFFVESINHGSLFHLEKEERFFWIPLSRAESLLPREQFCRCHKSFVVNMKQIREADGRKILLSNGSRLDIGARYAVDFKENFVRFLNR